MSSIIKQVILLICLALSFFFLGQVYQSQTSQEDTPLNSENISLVGVNPTEKVFDATYPKIGFIYCFISDDPLKNEICIYILNIQDGYVLYQHLDDNHQMLIGDPLSKHVSWFQDSWVLSTQLQPSKKG